ncbi:hypothetical protein [Devosia sp. 1566]|uniref:hypothetical protein n=1 Tax=Devosia sp. 1566 TaxID=2499144 RepID=UPI000FD945F3|nr:hypothetical protein [Devosia sp. 1566]
MTLPATIEPHWGDTSALLDSFKEDATPMRESTPAPRKRFRLYAFASGMFLVLGGAAAVLAGITPATAATLAQEPDTQIAVFMVPLTLLVLAILVEVTRVALRGNLPAEAPARIKPSRLPPAPPRR